MELATTLKGQSIQNRIRAVDINPSYWYPLEWANQATPSKITPITVWRRAIGRYRDTQGRLHALNEQHNHLANPNQHYVESIQPLSRFNGLLSGNMKSLCNNLDNCRIGLMATIRRHFPWLR